MSENLTGVDMHIEGVPQAGEDPRPLGECLDAVLRRALQEELGNDPAHEAVRLFWSDGAERWVFFRDLLKDLLEHFYEVKEVHLTAEELEREARGSYGP